MSTYHGVTHFKHLWLWKLLGPLFNTALMIRRWWRGLGWAVRLFGPISPHQPPVIYTSPLLLFLSPHLISADWNLLSLPVLLLQHFHTPPPQKQRTNTKHVRLAPFSISRMNVYQNGQSNGSKSFRIWDWLYDNRRHFNGKSRISNQAYWLNLVSFTGHHWQLFAVANSHDASINSNGVCSANYTLI